MSQAPIKITHVIVELHTGGAERSLLRLVRETKQNFEHRIICFGQPTSISAQIEAHGIPIYWVDYRANPLTAMRDARRELRRVAPDIVQGWMYFGNFLASLLCLTSSTLRKHSKCAWNIRQSPDDMAAEKLRTRLAMHLARLPGMHPHLVIYNSHAGVLSHASLGYNRRHHIVISNGIDTSVY